MVGVELEIEMVGSVVEVEVEIGAEVAGMPAVEAEQSHRVD